MRNHCKGVCYLRLRLPAGAACRPRTLARAACRAPSRGRRSAAILAAVVAAAVLAAPAHAQLSASASLVSDYSVRGISLSQGRPEAQLRVDYDASGGWYLGTLASGVSLPDSNARQQLLAYGGYAQRLPSGLSWEAGALDVSFLHDTEYRYHEFYAGLAGGGTSARLYYSPAYYGNGRTLYAELNHTVPLRGHLSLSAHLGLLHPVGDSGEGPRQTIDGRLALGMDFGDLNLQLALQAAAPGGPLAARRLAIGATYGF